MSDLTRLSISDLAQGYRNGVFSPLEVTKAYLAAMEKGRALNAYVLETPDHALKAAEASEMRFAADRKSHVHEARPLEGIPLGIKDLFATAGVRTTACSKILGNFIPAYESTVTANLWRDGAVMLGKLNNDEFAMGSSNETSAFGPVVNPWRRKGSNVGATAGQIEGAHLVPGG
ncbi:MAG: amidase family protein, partial [Bosea sp. (in: a-proteobacteria)]